MIQHHPAHSPTDCSAQPSLQPLRILIVDDEPMLRSVIQDFLMMLGFEDQCVAGDGREAVETLRTHSPIDLMISDIRMPEMELEDVLAVVRQEFPLLTVIATSGYSDFGTASGIIRKGAHDFLGKPLNLDDLEQAVNWIVERRRILHTGRLCFGPEQTADPAGAAALRVRLREEMTASQCFPELMSHAMRVGQLCETLDCGLGEAGNRDLAAACFLHELGVSTQIHNLIQQSRRLEEDEYQLILHAVRQQAGMIGESIGQPQVTPIIRRHLNWLQLASEPEDPASHDLGRQLSIWLGMLNSIDGLLHDRADRPGFDLPAVREWFGRHQQQRPIPALEALFGQWEKIEAFYQKQ